MPDLIFPFKPRGYWREPKTIPAGRRSGELI